MYINNIKGRNIVGLHSPRHTKYVNSITTFKYSWPDYGVKIKDKPNMRHGPDRPNWAPLLIIRERHIVTA